MGPPRPHALSSQELYVRASAEFRSNSGGGRITDAVDNRMSSVEKYNIVKDEWAALDGLLCFRVGCVGFFVKNEEEEEREFWGLDSYGESRTISGVFWWISATRMS